jgi:uncharacterized protein
MDADGIDAAFLYPSIGLSLGGVADPELAHALFHAYNLWLADYCKPYPDASSALLCCRCIQSS